jgi:CHAD domain-containing protein
MAGEPTEYRERELKFDVSPDWVLPPVDDSAPEGGEVTVDTVHLTSTYFDTASHHLLAAGVTLRRRVADTDSCWQLKVPDGDARVELREDLNGARVPKSLTDLVRGVRAGAPLRPVAKLTTTRNRHIVRDDHGRALAEIADDQVSVTIPGAPERASRWREIKVELIEGSEGLLTEVGGTLRKAGAVPSPSRSKLARALREPRQPRRTGTSLGRLIHDYIAEQVDVIARCDIELRRSGDVVHPARVACRRIRSVLRVFNDVLDPARAEHLDAELKWFAGVMGDIRDREVLRLRLDDAVNVLPEEPLIGPVIGRIDAMLGSERDAAKAQLTKTMNGTRYFSLMRDLKAWQAEPPFAGGVEPTGGVADRVAAAAKKVRHRLKTATQKPDTDAALHRARKAAKRARYVAELAEPRLGKTARKSVAWAKQMQDRLGGLHDNVIASEFLIRAGRAAELAGESSFTFGVLYDREQQQARKAERKARNKIS